MHVSLQVETYVKGAKSASDNAVALFKTAATVRPPDLPQNHFEIFSLASTSSSRDGILAERARARARAMG
jgi:hypothetical protein